MRRVPRWALAAVPIVVAGLALSGCGSSAGGGAETKAQQQAVGQNDINPQDVAKLKDGGEVKWPVEDYPAQFNMLQGDATNGDIPPIVQAMMPTPAVATADGNWGPDPDYVESFQLTSTEPQKVTFKLNPKAKWSDGTPITWVDYQSQWQASNGKNTAFNVLSTAGYANISDISRGASDYEFTATFQPKYAEWQGIFTVLYPKSATSNPDEFNKGWKDSPKVTAGPFKIGKLDPTAKTVTVVRDPAWWGAKPKLDDIIFKYMDSGQTKADALANGEIDSVSVASDLNVYKRVKDMKGVVLRRATLPNYRTMVFNGQGKSILKDAGLRTALMRGIDREAITKALAAELLPDAAPLGNHLYVKGFPGYEDHSGPYSYDPKAAAAKLDELGWKLTGSTRSKDGVPLKIRDVVPSGTAASQQEAQMVQKQLGEIGVTVDIVTVDSHGFFDQHVVPGDFDITHFAQMRTVSPVADALSSFTVGAQAQQNYGGIGNDKINKLLSDAAVELDDTKRADLMNQADKELWDVGHSLPLYRRPSIVAVHDKLANFGNWGLANVDYTKIGWLA